MNNRSIALAIAALSTGHITTADAQSVYVAPGGVYIASGPVYVIAAPSNGNGSYIEPIYDNGNGYGYGNGVLEPSPYLAPVVAAPGSGYVVTPYDLNGNGYAYGYRNGYGPPRPPAYHTGDPVLSSYGLARVPQLRAANSYHGNAIEDAKRVSRSRTVLQHSRITNGVVSDAIASDASDISFIGEWGVDVAQCHESPLTITARRAEAFGAACVFRSTQRESSNVWRLRAQCGDNSERWNANIRFSLSSDKLTWSSERGTTIYRRCPS
jgi:hypothetical protein